MFQVVNPAFGWCHVAAGTQHKAYLRTKLASKLRSQASHYDSHAADTNAPNNMLTHIKSGYGFESVYISDTYTFLIHIRFCSLCILLRCKVLACSTYLLAIMTDHPCRDLLLCTYAVYRTIILTCCAYRHTRSLLTLVQVIYCAGRIEDIKNNLVHYAYSEISSLTKSFFTSVS